MDEEDRYTRITLRLPKDLHAQLGEAAAATSKSVNAEIVARLHRTAEWQEEAERFRRLYREREVERDHARARLDATVQELAAEGKRLAELRTEILKLKSHLEQEQMRRVEMERSLERARKEMEDVNARSGSAELVQALKSAIEAKDELLARTKSSQDYWATQALECADRFRAAYKMLPADGQADPLFISQYERAMSNIFLARELLLIRGHRPHPDEIIRFTPLSDVQNSDESKAYAQVVNKINP